MSPMFLAAGAYKYNWKFVSKLLWLCRFTKSMTAGAQWGMTIFSAGRVPGSCMYGYILLFYAIMQQNVYRHHISNRLWQRAIARHLGFSDLKVGRYTKTKQMLYLTKSLRTHIESFHRRCLCNWCKGGQRTLHKTCFFSFHIHLVITEYIPAQR